MSLKTIDILTYNVWCDRHRYEQRAALLFEQIATAGYPTVVALQEVTRRFLPLLLKSSLLIGLIDKLASSRGAAAAVQGAGSAARACKYRLVIEPGLGPLKPMVTALLIRADAAHPPSTQHVLGCADSVSAHPDCHHFAFADPDADMDRGVLACIVRVPEGQGLKPGAVVVVATTHLESPDVGADNFHTRRRQCAAALNYVERLAVEASPIYQCDLIQMSIFRSP